MPRPWPGAAAPRPRSGCGQRRRQAASSAPSRSARWWSARLGNSRAHTCLIRRPRPRSTTASPRRARTTGRSGAPRRTRGRRRDGAGMSRSSRHARRSGTGAGNPFAVELQALRAALRRSRCYRAHQAQVRIEHRSQLGRSSLVRHSAVIMARDLGQTPDTPRRKRAWRHTPTLAAPPEAHTSDQLVLPPGRCWRSSATRAGDVRLAAAGAACHRGRCPGRPDAMILSSCP